MKLKISLLLFLLNTIGSSISAQSSWVWAQSPVNPGSDIGNDVTTDSLGNVYTVGNFSPFSLVFDTVTISQSSGNTNFFLIKHDPAGNALWGRTVTGSSNCSGTSVSADSAGNIFITGYFNGNLAIGNTTLTNTDQFGNTSDIFIAKYDTDGNFIWARNPSGSGNENSHCCSVDRSGNCYVTGYFSSSALTFGTIPVSNSDVTANTPDIFLAKYDPNGAVLWAKSEGEVGNEVANSVSADVFGNVVMAGYFLGSQVIFGTDTLNNNGTYGDIFMVKYDGNGNQLWTIHEGGNASELAYSVDTDPSGAVLIAGQFQSQTMMFGTTTITNADGVGNYSDIYVARYDADGNFQWVATAGGNRSDHATGVSADEYGNVFVTGGFESAAASFGITSVINADNTASTYDIFVSKYDSTGTLEWVKRSGGNDDDIGFALTTDLNNTCSVTGYFKSTTSIFGADTLTNTSTTFVTYDVFIAHLEDPTMVTEHESTAQNISVWPNPSVDGKFYLASDLQNGELIVTDITGKIVFRQQVNSPVFEADLYSLQAGIYTASLLSESGTSTIRIVKLN